MICVIVGRGRHASMVQEWKEAVEAGADLVEIRADCLRRDIDFKRLIPAERPCPLIFTIRRSAEGGLWRHDEEKRLRLIREAIVDGVDYVDLEMDIAEKVPRYGRTKRIVSYHNMKKTPRDLPEIMAKMADMHADIVKVAVMPQNLEDAAFLFKCARDFSAKMPVIGISMGELGFFTRILGPLYGAPFTYSILSEERVFAPGLPTYKSLRRDYFYSQINKSTKVYAVIGDPIGHSLSPAVHNAVFHHFEQRKTYVPIRVPSAELKGVFASLSGLDIQGLSITIPHKEAIVPLLDEEDPAVDKTIACNTIEMSEGNRIGHNTDFQAALEALEDALGGKLEGGLSPLHNKQVLILGAGGVARAIAFALAGVGAGLTICNRNEERASQLASEVGCKSVNWTMRASTLCDILINCTPVGMHPNVNESPVPPAAFRAKMIVFDTVYHPEQTMFLKLAADRDCQVVTGVDMFVRQAALQAYYFAGEVPPLDLIRKVVVRKFSPLKE